MREESVGFQAQLTTLANRNQELERKVLHLEEVSATLTDQVRRLMTEEREDSEVESSDELSPSEEAETIVIEICKDNVEWILTKYRESSRLRHWGVLYW